MKPRRWLFVSVPLWGHLDYGGYLDLAVALARRGHQVLWASGPLIQEAVVRRGLPFAPLASVGWRWLPPWRPERVPPTERERQRRERALDAWLHPEEHARGLRALGSLIEAWRPDVLVAEPFAGAAAWAAERYDLPLIVVGFPAGRWPNPTTPEAREALQQAQARLAHVAASLGLTGRYWRADPFPQIVSPLAHIVFFPAPWFSDLEALDPQNRFFGGRRGAAMDLTPNPRPRALITLGSTFTEDPAFFIGAAQAVQRLGGEPIVVLGRSPFALTLKETVRRALPDLPLLEWVEYDQLFPTLDLVIHHGGMGTTHTALVHGVPQLIVPHAGEQHLQARRAEAAGVGRMLHPSEATPRRWEETIAGLLETPHLRAQARRWAEMMHAAGHAEEAAEAVIEIA
ncbi:glycosyltransferase [Thermoflexus sp.]|uniref:glycosyltransferase n=1 Tax=Thermoflexus sp. TaxID=1969742 RepID=UPI0035E45509